MITTASAAALTPLLSTSLQLPLTLGVNAPILLDGLKELLHEGINSHVLEAMAVAVSLWRRDYNAANITHLLLEIGEYIEATTSQESDALLRELIRPNVEEVWVMRGTQERRIPYSLLKVGDIVVVGVGDMIGVDGHIVEGEALVNQASMTGESAPVVKKYGERVMSGTLVEEGRIKIWAEYVGDDTATARVSRYISYNFV